MMQRAHQRDSAIRKHVQFQLSSEYMRVR